MLEKRRAAPALACEVMYGNSYFPGIMNKVIFVSHCQPQIPPPPPKKNITLLSAVFLSKGFKTISENTPIWIQPQLLKELHFSYSGLYIAINLFSGTL